MLEARIDTARRVVDALFADEDALLDSVVADGWPRPMAREGFAMHRETWNVDAIADTIAREAELVDGPLVSSTAHLWPALPGAGVTPMLYGFLAGVPTQVLRSSQRSEHFADLFVRTWREHDDSVTLSEGWRDVERIIVSGSDETIDALVDEFGASHVTGYGHRISLAIVDDEDPERWAQQLADDVVLWHQAGCFSCRAVVFVGSPDDAHDFGRALADAIADAESRLGSDFDEGQLAQRMQALGTAQFETEVFEARQGWVEMREKVVDAARPPHVVPVVAVEDIDQITRVVDVPPRNVQGIALAGPRGRRVQLADVAELLGATRCALPGQLQQPPAAWPHDGAPNLAAFTGEASGRVRRTTTWIDAIVASSGQLTATKVQ